MMCEISKRGEIENFNFVGNDVRCRCWSCRSINNNKSKINKFN